ncbi:MAG: hypothetical protein K2X27_03275 [Candidatus Obscuribacterales bacterium]|nr:hypothetical protein [Candidatus Obscuribacterales bacterium]
MNLDQQLDFFFRDPASQPTFRVGDNLFSNLYLLRRDINTCYSGGAVWPGVMGIMAGIDLLAKFFAGTDLSAVSERFRDFTNEYISNNNVIDSEVLYQLRNALLHSFGLYSKRRATQAEKTNQGFDRQDYAFRLGGAGNLISLTTAHPIQAVGTNPDQVRVLLTEYDIDVHALLASWNAAIGQYQAQLQSQGQLRNRFATQATSDLRSLFDMYGVTNLIVAAGP